MKIKRRSKQVKETKEAPMTAEVMEVTPDMAGDWLALNTNNRPLREHHVQNLAGTSGEVQSRQQAARSQEEANAWSVRLELQADCYAGVWAAHASEVSGGQVALEQGDIEEGLNAASRIGDDVLSGGRASPDSFTHGTGEQRVEWLRRGYQSGDPAQCDTFPSITGSGGGGSSYGK